MERLQPSEELAAIVGHEPMSQAQVVEELWGYIRENGLQDPGNPRRIRADDHLGRIFAGKDRATLVEVAKRVSRHLIAGAQGEQAEEEVLWREFEKEMLGSCYETLGCFPEMSDEELKREFRELCRVFHPDRLAGEEIPAGIIRLAGKRFQEIQSAYEVVVKSRTQSSFAPTRLWTLGELLKPANPPASWEPEGGMAR